MKWKILVISIIGILALFGYQLLLKKESQKLKGIFIEIEPEIRIHIGYRTWHLFQNNNTKANVEVLAPKQEVDDVINGKAAYPTLAGHKYIGSFIDNLYSTSTPILKDNEFFATGGKNAASTSREVRVKYINQEIQTKFENEL